MRSLALVLGLGMGVAAQAAEPDLTLSWKDNILTIHGKHLPGGKVEVWYLEAYCRPGSTDRDWRETVIGHTTRLVKAAADGKSLQLECTLKDGVVVGHAIKADKDMVRVAITAHNPTPRPSEVHWAQPCIRVGAFTGHDGPDRYAYLKKSFLFLDGKPAFMPTRDWATEARYTPGQVWRPRGVPRDDVNPRPLSKHTPSNGLIGCVSADDKWILAVAFEPYQELFQGVIRCLHSDFRIGGLTAGETKRIRGTIYLVPNDMKALVERYEKDFPEHKASATDPEKGKTDERSCSFPGPVRLSDCGSRRGRPEGEAECPFDRL